MNEKQKAFLKVVFGQKSSDTFSKRIEELAEEAKHNTQWRKQYMDWERQRAYDFEAGKEVGIEIGKEIGIKAGKEAGIEIGKEMGIEAGKEAGIEIGIEKKAEEVAIKLLEKEIPPETIVEYVELPLEKVLELQKSNVVKD